MWLIFTRTPHPDATYWPGRRLLAAVDAVVWPGMCVLVVAHVPSRLGVMGLVVAAWAAWSGVARLHRALLQNHRYRFTTWRWGAGVIGLLLFGAFLKLATNF